MELLQALYGPFETMLTYHNSTTAYPIPLNKILVQTEIEGANAHYTNARVAATEKGGDTELNWCSNLHGGARALNFQMGS